ncbi:hypothetical protein EQM14_11285 [Caproiciproducens sp. NJN-50]|uniref:tripartite tricarboxylate transporter TctB family protein n=1 Tax=Acutalibacteraceae TaxID=3082771 RepID=UPI000FFE23D4|nr:MULTISPECIES: tripartite tricarboxylate transporter TctB family protein [Acutalibacteraceae]QAT50296.1 hypothetical protein EQM14_11285 [Caproiciproducens sp. NJN-50]
MKKETLRKVDLVFSLILIIVSVGTMLECVRMFFNPFEKDFANEVSGNDVKDAILYWYTSPAFLPVIIAIAIMFCAIMLFRLARKSGAKFDFFTKEKAVEFIKNPETAIAVFVIGTIAVYILCLIPACRQMFDVFPHFQGFPFMIATFILLAVQMVVLNEKSLKKIMISLLVAAVSSAAVTYCFGTLAMIPLP